VYNINRIKLIFTLLLCLKSLYSNCVGADFMGLKELELPPIFGPRGSYNMCPQ